MDSKNTYLKHIIREELQLVKEQITLDPVPPKPKALPIAITISPTRKLLESPNSAKGNFSWISIFNNAKSVLGSVPTTRAENSLLSNNLTKISSEPEITW